MIHQRIRIASNVVMFRMRLDEALEGFKKVPILKTCGMCAEIRNLLLFKQRRSLLPPTKAIFNLVQSLNWSSYALIECSHFSGGSHSRLITVCGSFKLTTAIFETSDS